MPEFFLTASGVALPALLISWAIRRWYGLLEWRVAGGLLVLVFIVLARPIFSRDMPVPLDEVVRGYPYRGIFGEVRSKNPDTNDTVKQMLPWMQVAREEIFAFRAPLWNRYSFSGYPLLGNGQSAPLSPFFLLTLFVPLPKQLVAMAGLKLFVGLLFSYLMLKRESVSSWAAAFGAVVFALSIFQNVYLYYPLSSVTFLFPAIAFAAVECIRQPNFRHVVLAAILTACMLAAGHPESVIHSVLGVAILITLELLLPPDAETRRRGDAGRTGLRVSVSPYLRVGGTVVGAVTGGLIAAPAWVPVLLQALDSQRMLAISQGGFASPVYPLNALWVLFNPDGYGNPARGNWSWIFHYIMVAPTYVGLLPLALAAGSTLAPAAARRDRALVIAALLIFLVAMNWTFFGNLVNQALSWAANDRLRFVVVLLIAMAAARAVERIVRSGAVFEMIAAAMVAAIALYLFANRFEIVGIGSAIALVSLIGFWILFMFRHRLAGWTVPLAALVAAAAELLYFNGPFNAMTRREYYRPPLPIIGRIHAEAPAEPFRILGLDWVFLPNAAAQYRLEDIRGSDPMAWRDYVEFFRIIQAPGQSFDVGRVQDIAHPAVVFLNVRYLLAEPDSQFGSPYRLIYRGRDGTLYRHEQWTARFFTPANLVRRGEVPFVEQLSKISDFRQTAIVDGASGPNHVLPGMWIRQMSPHRFRITLDTPKRTLVASSQPAEPGWRVRVNGKVTPICRVNGAFIGFFVPAGKARIVVEYKPAAFYWPVAASLTAVAALAGWPLARRNKGGGEAVTGRSARPEKPNVNSSP